jgi:single-strand DNA-binding protein
MPRNSQPANPAHEWHSIILWRGLADLAEKYLKKGKYDPLRRQKPHPLLGRQAGRKRYVTEVVGKPCLFNIMTIEKQ